MDLYHTRPEDNDVFEVVARHFVAAGLDIASLSVYQAKPTHTEENLISIVQSLYEKDPRVITYCLPVALVKYEHDPTTQQLNIKDWQYISPERHN